MTITSYLAALATSGFFNKEWTAKGISIDTRSIKEGNLFVALEGKNSNGHMYLDEAFKKGAAAAIINRNMYKTEYNKYPLLLVEDTFIALQNLAKYIREIFKGKVVGITGSVGKTTSKDMISFLLSKINNVVATKGNFNNEIGLPLSISEIMDNTEFGVFEIGMSAKGEISKLSSILKPDIAVITEVSNAHSINFKHIEEIALAKLEIIEGLNENGILILNSQSNMYDFLINKVANKVRSIYSFGFNQSDDFKILSYNFIENSNFNIGYEIKASIFNEEVSYFLQTLAEHNVLLSVMALGVLKLLGVNISSVVKFFEEYKITEGRGNINVITYNNTNNKNITFTLIDDSYNANPLSMQKSILMLKNLAGERRKVLVLGDMLELSSTEEELEHLNLQKFILQSQVNKVFTVGDNMLTLFHNLPNNIKGESFLEVNSLFRYLEKFIMDDDIVLVKGSFSSKVHMIVKNFKQLQIKE